MPTSTSLRKSLRSRGKRLVHGYEVVSTKKHRAHKTRVHKAKRMRKGRR